MVAFITTGSFGLGPDEAQYWTWSQQLALGYYSKPPAIAWQVAFGTFIFGNTELGVRFGSLLIGSLIPLATYKLASSCRLPAKAAALAALMMAFSPIGILASFLAITDGGMVLFWTLATSSLCLALSQKSALPFYKIGGLVMCGALFKWPAYAFWLPVFALVSFRRQLFSKHLFGGLFISLLGLLPSIVWNIEHKWPTFKHVLATVHHTPAVAKGNFWEFIGMQALLLFPLSFVLLIGILATFLRRKSTLTASLKVCFLVPLCFVTALACLAYFKKIQGNWCDFIYPLAIVALVWGCTEYMPSLKKWLLASFSLSSLLMLALPFMASFSVQNAGHTQLAKVLNEAGYNPTKDFLFADKYQMSSLLSFYGPFQKRAYFLNLQAIRKNQFSYWPGMHIEQLNQTGFFVCTERAARTEVFNPAVIQKMLKPYFEDVTYLGIYPLSHKHKLVKNCFIFKCTNYNGLQPQESGLY